MKSIVQASSLVKAVSIVGTSLIIGLVFDVLFYTKVPGISVLIFLGAVFGALFGLSRVSHQRLSRQTLWLTIPLLFEGIMIAIRSSISLTTINILACLVILLVMFRAPAAALLTRLKFMDYAELILLPFQWYEPAIHTLGDIVATHKTYKDRPALKAAAKGIIISVPVLAVFIALFASADLVVQRLVMKAFNFQINIGATYQLCLILIVAFIFTGALSYTLTARVSKKKESKSEGRKTYIGQIESSILLGSVNMLFFAFIIIQLAYFFGGQSNISVDGFTYAEYARKGFFELLVVGIIAFIMLMAAENFVGKVGEKHTKLFKSLSIILIAQVIVIMASAFKRLYLYEQAYGFTVLRLYSHAFVILLAVIFILLAYKIIASAPENRCAFMGLISVFVFIVVMNLLNPDKFIASQNINRYHVTGKLDTAYIGSLSADAAPVLVQSIPGIKDEEQLTLSEALVKERNTLRTHEYHQWQSWNYARSRGLTELDKVGQT